MKQCNNNKYEPHKAHTFSCAKCGRMSANEKDLCKSGRQVLEKEKKQKKIEKRKKKLEKKINKLQCKLKKLLNN